MPPGKGARRRRGAVLIVAVFMALALAMLVGAALTYTAAQYRNTLAKTRSDAALLLAEAAINDELSYISRRAHRNVVTERSTQPSVTTSGQRGRLVTLPSVPGRAWVYSTAEKATLAPWNGVAPTFWIHARAEVFGSWRTVRIQAGQGMWSRFYDLAVVAASPSRSSSTPALTIEKTSRTDIQGGIGTNGGFDESNGSSFSFEYAVNGYVAGAQGGMIVPGNGQGGPNAQGPIYDTPDFIDIPTVESVLRDSFPSLALAADPWAWIATNNDNDRIRTFVTNGDISPVGTTLLGATKSQNVLTNALTTPSTVPNLIRAPGMGNAQGRYSQGSMTGLSASDSRRALIFPPGDYYFTEIDLNDMNAYEIIVDGLGLSVGGNPTGKQVRFWLHDPSSPTSDVIGLALRYTHAHPRYFRLYSDKESLLTIDRPGVHAVRPNEMYDQYGAILQTGVNRGALLTLKGGNGQSKEVTWHGTIYGDRIVFDDRWTVIHPGEAIASAFDPKGGVSFLGGYEIGG